MAKTRKRASRKRGTGKNLRKVIRKEINKQSVGEIKELDTSPDATYLVSYDVPVVYPLTLTAQGDTQAQREGREIGMKRIQLYVACFRNASNTTGSHDRMSIALVKCKRAVAGTAPTWSDVFAYTGQHNSVVPFRNIDARDQSEYVVVKKWHVDLGDSTGNPKSTKIINWSKSYKVPQKITYSGSNASLADSAMGHYFLIATSDVISTGYPPAIQYACRVHFMP